MKTWGPYFWGALHIACLASPPVLSDEHKTAFRNLIESYTLTLPCPACQMHFREVLQMYPLEPNLNFGSDLFAWSVTVHNVVNAKIGKPIVSLRDAVFYWVERSNYQETYPVEDTLVILGLAVAISFLLIK